MQTPRLNALLLFIACWCLPISLSAQQLPLQIARTQQSPTQFVLAQILEEIYKESQIELKINSLPPNRSNELLRLNQIDGDVGQIFDFSEQHPYLVMVKPAIAELDFYAYSKKKLVINSLDDLKKYSVGIQRGNTAAEKLSKEVTKVTIANSAEQLFRMLDADRFDIAISAEFNGRYAINNLGLKQIIPITKLGNFPIYHYLTEKNRALSLKLTNAIKSLQRSGRLQALQSQIEFEIVENLRSIE